MLHTTTAGPAPLGVTALRRVRSSGRKCREEDGRAGEGFAGGNGGKRTTSQKPVFGEDGDGVDEEDGDCCLLAVRLGLVEE